MELKLIIIGWFLGAISLLGGTILQFFLARHQTKNQFLMEVKLMIYAKLLSAVKSEESYPKESSSRTSEEVNKYNYRLHEWRKSRKLIKGLASEALLVTKNNILQEKLTKFISTHNPDESLHDIEDVMREDIGV